MDYRELGQRIKDRREELNISQSDIVSALGIDQGKVSLIEAGKRKIQFDEVKPLAEALLVPVRWFFYEDNSLNSTRLFIDDPTLFKLVTKANDAWVKVGSYIALEAYEMGILGECEDVN